jgi:hypothetical protein
MNIIANYFLGAHYIGGSGPCVFGPMRWDFDLCAGSMAISISSREEVRFNAPLVPICCRCGVKGAFVEREMQR